MITDPADYLAYRIFVVVIRHHHRHALRHRRLCLVEEAQGARSREIPYGFGDCAAHSANAKIHQRQQRDEAASTCVHFGERSLT